MAAASRLFPCPPSRVVLLRALKVGDLLCSVPAFRALRSAWPESTIILVGLPWARTFVDRYSHYLDGFRELPGFPGLPEVEPQVHRLPGFLADLQAERCDLAIQMHGSGPFVNPLTVLFGARRSAGFYLPGDYCPDPQLFCPWPDHGREVDRLLHLVRFLDLPTAGAHLEFPLRPADHQALRRLPGTEDLAPGTYVCIHPGASVPERRWPPEGFAAVGQALARHGLRIVLTGGSAEVSLAERVTAALPGAVNLAGHTDLGSLGALLSGARLLVCNDTGVSHMADALRVPSVVLSTADNPARWAPADTRLHRVLCRDQGIHPDEVIAVARELLRTSSSSVAAQPPDSLAPCRCS